MGMRSLRIQVAARFEVTTGGESEAADPPVEDAASVRVGVDLNEDERACASADRDQHHSELERCIAGAPGSFDTVAEERVRRTVGTNAERDVDALRGERFAELLVDFTERLLVLLAIRD